ncbi:hypothetical protein lerEdw1_015190 [Lerista edwardsae]|nr:hypothetical protein lerEdw1_015192 [Lerista edwardsae]KAJ6612177.1 hypothetical protein lerEdw1_015190 [Lerista edwardsae]
MLSTLTVQLLLLPHMACRAHPIACAASEPALPSETLQYLGIVHLLVHFGWKWVGLITQDDDAGYNFLRKMELLLHENGMCSAFTETVTKNYRYTGMSDIVSNLLNDIPAFLWSTAKAVVVYGENVCIRRLASILLRKSIFSGTDSPRQEKDSMGKVWITTAQIDFTTKNLSHQATDYQFSRNGHLPLTDDFKFIAGMRMPQNYNISALMSPPWEVVEVVPPMSIQIASCYLLLLAFGIQSGM